MKKIVDPIDYSFTSSNYNFNSNEFYKNQFILSYYPKYKIFCIFGSRGRGKTYSGKKLILNRFRAFKAGKKKVFKKIAWIRLTDTQVQKILQDNGLTFFEQTLLRKYKVDVKTVNENIYFKYYHENDDQWVHIGKAFSLQQYGSWKGNQFEDYDLIIVDELVRLETERNTFSVPSAFIHSLENIARERQDVRVIIYANTIGEMMDIRDLFGFLPYPGKFGVYKLYSKQIVIEYLKDSKEWKSRKKNTLAGRLAGKDEAFSNMYHDDVKSKDVLIIPRKEVYKPSSKTTYVARLEIAKGFYVDIWHYKNLFYIDHADKNKHSCDTRYREISENKVMAIKTKYMSPDSIVTTHFNNFIKAIIAGNKVRYSDASLYLYWRKYMQLYRIIN